MCQHALRSLCQAGTPWWRNASCFVIGVDRGLSMSIQHQGMPGTELLDSLLSRQNIVQNAMATAVLFGTVLLARVLLLRLVRGKGQAEADQLRSLIAIRQASWGLLLLGLVGIWTEELTALGLSLLAIAVAIVIATKELILCAMGSMYRASSGAFKVGDRIEVKGLRGDVIDNGLLATRVLLVGPGHQRTGRVVTIPNSVLLADPVVNETFTDEYVIHMIYIPLSLKADVSKLEEALLTAARAVSREFVEPARRHMQAMAKRHGLQAPDVSPQVVLQLPEAGKAVLVLRVPTLAREKGRVEQDILRSLTHKHRGLLADVDAMTASGEGKAP